MTLRHITLALLLAPPLAFSAGCHASPSSTSSMEATEEKGDASSLPLVKVDYQKFVLDNGLTVLVNEDHRAPVVSIATYYHVGSGDETPGHTGFAHLFEHLMFNGSEHADDDWFNLMNGVGATGMNGTTSFDRTNYFETVPKGALDRVLWLESDRMQNLLPAVDQATLDEQRKVVQNEKRQRANNPLGQVPDITYAATYPVGHPYSWTPIGSMKDLNAASLDDVRKFFKKWYSPGNAVLALSGDITVAEAREKVEKYYGDIPGGPALHIRHQNVAKMTGAKRDTLQADVANPQLLEVWNVPGWANADTQLLRLAASVLSDGENGRLQKHLVREQKLASEVKANVTLLELGSQFTVSATVRPGVSVDKLKAAIDAELETFLRDGPTREELDRTKFQRYSGYVRGVTSTMGKAQALAEGELWAGDPDFYLTRQKVTYAATPKSVRDVARKWLTDGSYALDVSPLPDYKTSGKAVDRDTMPAIAKPAPFQLPPLQHATLSNGIKVALAERHDVPTVGMMMMFDIGMIPDRNPASIGRNQLGLAMSGTTTRSELDISAQLQELGARMGWMSNREITSFSMNGLKTRLDETLDLYTDILLHPTFPADVWKHKQALFTSNFEENKRTPQGKSALVYSKMLYGPDHPYSAVLTPEIVKNLSVDDFRTFYKKWIRPDSATILIVGDTTLADIVPKLEKRLGGWKAQGTAPVKPSLPDPAVPTRPRVILFDQPGAESSLISVAETGPARNAPDYDVSDVADTVLGGYFLSRLNMKLREEKGWSYGANSRLATQRLLGQLDIGTAVQTDKTAPAMREIERELHEIGSTRPPTGKEIEKAKNAMVLGMSAMLQSPDGALRLYRDTYEYDLPTDYWNNYVQTIQGMTTTQVQAAAKQLYRPSQSTWFVIGDLSKIEADIRKLDLGEVMVYNADGHRVR